MLFRLAAQGYEPGVLAEEDAAHIVEHWKFGNKAIAMYIVHSLRESSAGRGFAGGMYKKTAASAGCKPVAFSFMPHHGAITGLCTLPDHQRKGLASVIVRQTICWCLSKGLTAYCSIEGDNSASQAFFANLGFRSVGQHQPWLCFSPAISGSKVQQ